MSLSLIQKLKLLAKLNSTVNEVEKGITMKDSTKIIAAIIGLLTTAAQIPFVQTSVQHFFAAHPAASLIVAGITTILALFHVPVDASKKIAPMLIIALALLAPGFAFAQKDAPANVAPLQNIYGAGVSYSVGGSPAVAGTGLYARQLSDSGTYAFTAVDALPNTLKPFTVSTNVGVGIAQKLFTIGKVPVYVPTALGISWTGSNTGWQYNAGALAVIHLKGNYYVMPTARFLKSSVSNGTGYQPIIGVLFGFGQ
jgi:hypothetical protein